MFFFFQAEDGIRDLVRSRGLGDVYKRQREWGEKGIRSNALVAGFMETSMSSTLSKEQRDRIFKRTSLKIPTTIESVANMVEFLLSDSSHSVTGANVFVDSGTI